MKAKQRPTAEFSVQAAEAIPLTEVNVMRCVRIWFKKMGMSRYVSHLDLMRAMTRALRRAKVPLWYTEGYNPHPYITFALPLSLGMESLCESMDMRIEGDSTNEEIFSMLKDNMPPGIEIINVSEPVFDPKKIVYGEFDILFDCKNNAEYVAELVKDILSKDELIVQKLGKKGRHKVLKDINLIEFIKEYNKIPWKQIIGMRNRIVHGYDTINIEIVWRTAIESIPELKSYCKEILG